MHARCASVNMCVFPKQLRDFVSGTWEPMAAVCSYFNVIVMLCILLSSRVYLISATLLYSVYRHHTGVVIRESVPVCVCEHSFMHCVQYLQIVAVYKCVRSCWFLYFLGGCSSTDSTCSDRTWLLFSDGDGFCTRIRPMLIVHNIQ